ncbi:MAG: chlorosome envelope protein B [Candidatus Chlorobium antarcticum]|jgi:chlorosome envelope protein B|nr:chlorosome envelope protein B [Candidatus Chlorobium antarcticum]
MANGTTPDISGAINTLVETAGKLIQLQLDCMKNSLNLITGAAEPLGKAVTDLTSSIADTASQAIQSVSASIAPKK